jgi:hypothetical protein
MPGWNCERKAGSDGDALFAVVVADATVTGVTRATDVFGKLDRKVALSTDAGAGAALATATLAGVTPTDAIALRVACELAALA